MTILVIPQEEEILENLKTGLLGKKVVVNVQSVLWAVTPIEKISLTLTVTYVGEPVQIPYRYHKVSGNIEYRIKGQVTDKTKWNYGRIYEFWTMEKKERALEVECEEIELENIMREYA